MTGIGSFAEYPHGGADEVTQALSDRDWSGGVVDHGPVMIVHSARLPAALSERLEAEATRRGLTPSELICDLVQAGLQFAS